MKLKYPPGRVFAIYTIRADHVCSKCGYIDSYAKIGRTTDSPNNRMLSIQTNCPIPLSLARAHYDTAEYEAKLHNRFEHLHIRGEWFVYTPSMLTVDKE